MRVRRILRPLLMAGIVLSAVACEDDAGLSATGPIVQDSAGVEIVTSHAPEWEAGGAWELSEQPVLSIGGQESEDGHLIWQIAGGAGKLSDGRIALMTGQREAPRILIFDHAGRHVRSIGRQGQGPGEFVEPQHFQRLPGDRLAVWERMGGRITTFDTTGTVVDIRHLDLPRLTGALPFPTNNERVITLPDGSLIYSSFPSEGRTAAADLPLGEIYREPRVLTRVFRDYSTVALGAFPGRGQVPYEAYDGRSYFSSPPFAPFLYVEAASDPFRLYVNDGTDAGLIVVDSTGAVLRMIRRDVPARPVTDQDLDRWFDRMAAMNNLDQDRRAAAEREYLEWGGIPTHHQPMRGMWVDRTGYLWVVDESHNTNSATFSVFTPTGSWLGEMTLPFARILEIGEDYVLGVKEDEFGVESIHEHELRRRQ